MFAKIASFKVLRGYFLHSFHARPLLLSHAWPAVLGKYLKLIHLLCIALFLENCGHKLAFENLGSQQYDVGRITCN